MRDQPSGDAGSSPRYAVHRHRPRQFTLYLHRYSVRPVVAPYLRPIDGYPAG
jgi:hypothetical protein